MFRYFTHMFMQEWGMQRQVQVSILGACICAVLSVVLQGAARWTLLSICGVLAVWAMILLVTKPKEDKTPPPQLPQPMSQKQEMNNSGNAKIEQHFHGYPPAPITSPAPKQKERRELPRLEFIEAKMIYADHGNYGELVETDAYGAHRALVAIFRNPLGKVGSKNLTAYGVSAHLTFENDAGKKLNVAAAWIGEKVQSATFAAGKSHQLVVAIRDATKGAPCALENPNSYFPITMTWTAYRRALQNLRSLHPIELIKDCNKVTIELAGGDDDVTLYSAAFGFQVDESGNMQLTEKQEI
jgi:hypothetical protein